MIILIQETLGRPQDTPDTDPAFLGSPPAAGTHAFLGRGRVGHKHHKRTGLGGSQATREPRSEAIEALNTGPTRDTSHHSAGKDTRQGRRPRQTCAWLWLREDELGAAMHGGRLLALPSSLPTTCNHKHTRPAPPSESHRVLAGPGLPAAIRALDAGGRVGGQARGRGCRGPGECGVTWPAGVAGMMEEASAVASKA